jgi:hypothetical protein
VSAPRPPALRLLRGGLVAWLVAWFVLWRALGPYFVAGVGGWPVRQPFFPWPFDEPAVATVAYLAPIGLVGLLLRPTAPGLRIAAGIATACAAVLLLHGDAYNDATFLVGFWMGLWLLWLAGQSARTDRGVVAEAGALLVVIGAFLFLGGVVGKLHREWWDGEVMTHVLVEQRDYWFYPWLRTHLTGDAQLLLARWSARIGLGFEVLAVSTPVLPLRWGLVTLVVASLGVVACAGWTLLSVLGAPMGAALVCLWVLRSPATVSRNTSPTGSCTVP